MNKIPNDTELFTKLNNSMVNSMLKLTSYLQIADTSAALTPEEQFNIFYSVTDNSVSYLNMLRRDDIAVYKKLMFNDSLPDVRYDQDMICCYMYQSSLAIRIGDPDLYDHFFFI